MANDQEASKVVLGDDPVSSCEADWFKFKEPAVALTNQLLKISSSSGVCCGIIGSWGTGKSSFMKIMESYLKETHSLDCICIWFTAWDPGGISNLGDAMIFRFLTDIARDQKDFKGYLKELEK